MQKQTLPDAAHFPLQWQVAPPIEQVSSKVIDGFDGTRVCDGCEAAKYAETRTPAMAEFDNGLSLHRCFSYCE